jgi:transcriptional regulator with XRE-family HTH domain
MSSPFAFGPRLRWWRAQRGQSQLALAGAAEISQRHLSFLESGRTAVQADAAADGTAETAELARRLAAYPDAAALARTVPAEPHGPVLAIHFRKDDTLLKLFTTIATLGTAHDVTLQEIRIECFFPADAATAALLHAWA